MVNVEDWLEEDGLMLIECWSRDGYTYNDIAQRIGISGSALTKWRKKYPEIREAMKRGREIIDYKVENALLKSALGYQTKEVRVTTIMRYGKVVETQKEVLSKEQAPNVSAIQCWLFNRLPDKWKRNRDAIIDTGDEDTTIQVTVTRASENETEDHFDNSMNRSISIRNKTKEELEKEKQEKAKVSNSDTVVEEEEEDLDYWPEDWEDE